jgi:16S rRNA (guanine966-N2)-methyltransferase
MRIVAGTARGRRLVTPAGDEVRPTTDRVREAVFNALGSMGAVVGASVVDLFAGSGALGIEALSRGAGSVTFVDSSSVATRAVTENLRATGLEGAARVVRSDAWSYLAGQVDVLDLALLDPPYRFDRWEELLAVVPARLVVIESDRAVEVGPDAVVQRQRRYGGTVVTIAALQDRDEHGRRDTEDRS